METEQAILSSLMTRCRSMLPSSTPMCSKSPRLDDCGTLRNLRRHAEYRQWRYMLYLTQLGFGMQTRAQSR